VASYCNTRGIPVIGDMTFYAAFSLFRLAAILQGVFKRSLQGNASSENAKMFGSAVELMSDCAWEIVTKNPTTELFPFSPKGLEMKVKLLKFMDEHIYPKYVGVKANSRQF